MELWHIPARARGLSATVASQQQARSLALGLPETIEQDHHSRPSFRVAGVVAGTAAPRQEQGVTQQQLAEGSGISQADISRYERGLGNPTRATIDALAVALGAHLELVRNSEPGRAVTTDYELSA
jgi:ribosome-binding protein aMBF1 (putative translation factor)